MQGALRSDWDVDCNRAAERSAAPRESNVSPGIPARARLRFTLEWCGGGPHLGLGNTNKCCNFGVRFTEGRRGRDMQRLDAAALARASRRECRAGGARLPTAGLDRSTGSGPAWIPRAAHASDSQESAIRRRAGSNPRLWAAITSSGSDCTPNFFMMRARCALMLRSPVPRSSAVSRLVFPAITCWIT